MVSLNIGEVSNDQLAAAEGVIGQSKALEAEVKDQVDIVAGWGVMDRFERGEVQDEDLLQTGEGDASAGGFDLIDWGVDFNYGCLFVVS